MNRKLLFFISTLPAFFGVLGCNTSSKIIGALPNSPLGSIANPLPIPFPSDTVPSTTPDIPAIVQCFQTCGGVLCDCLNANVISAQEGSLTYNGTTYLNLGNNLVSSSDGSYKVSFWATPYSNATANIPGSVLLGTGGGIGTGFAIRQSTFPTGKLELVMGQNLTKNLSSYELVVMNDKPVGLWPLNDAVSNISAAVRLSGNIGSGGNMQNYTGSVYSGSGAGTSSNLGVGVTQPTLDSMPPNFGSFQAGSAVPIFDGNHFIQIPQPFDYEYSIEFWFNANNLHVPTSPNNCGNFWRGAGMVDAEEVGAYNDFGVSYCNGSVVFGEANVYTPYTGSDGRTTISAPASLGSWHHVVATKTYYPTPTLTLYIDGGNGVSGGQQISSPITCPTDMPSGSNCNYARSSNPALNPLTSAIMGFAPNTVNIGRTRSGAQYFQGAIAQVALYRYALSWKDVLRHYSAATTATQLEYSPNSVLADRPVGYWRLNEKTGNIVKDFSGHGFDGYYAAEGTPANIAMGRLGYQVAAVPGPYTAIGDSSKAPTFDGNGGFVIPDSPLLDASSGSIEFWIKGNIVTVGNETINLVSKLLNGKNGFSVYAKQSTLWSNILGRNEITTDVGAGINDGKWHHLAFTYQSNPVQNATSQTLNVRSNLYFDGALVLDTSGQSRAGNSAAPSGDQNFFDHVSPNTPLVGGGGSPNFKGSIAEVAMYNYPLSAAQIASHYKQANTGQVAWWACQTKKELLLKNPNFVEAVYNGTTGVAQLFLNGQEECSIKLCSNGSCSNSQPNSTYTTYQNGLPLYAGATPPIISNFWQGTMSALNISPVNAPKDDFDALTASTFQRRSPLSTTYVKDSSLVLHLDAANANLGMDTFRGYGMSCNQQTGWFDFSTFGNNATLYNYACPSTSSDLWVGGITGGIPAVPSFDKNNPLSLSLAQGAPNAALIATSNSLEGLTNTFTLEAWVMPTNLSSDVGLISKTAYSASSVGIFAAPFDFFIKKPTSLGAGTGIPTLRLGDGGTTLAEVEGVTRVSSVTSFTHLAVTVNPYASNPGSYEVHHFINGQPNDSTVLTDFIKPVNLANKENNPILIGMRSDRTIPMSGQFTIIRIYNRRLSGTEIMRNYNAEKARFY